MFFVVPVTFSDMFILNINVFFTFIRLTIFCFIYISGVSSICSEKKTVLCFLLICLCLFISKPAILQFLTSNNFLKRTVRYCFFLVLDYKYKSIL